MTTSETLRVRRPGPLQVRIAAELHANPAEPFASIAARLGCGVGTVQRVDRELRAAAATSLPGEGG